MAGKSITIHDLEPHTAKMLRARADAEGLSLNRMVKKLLNQALGIEPREVSAQRRAFEAFCGVWTESDAREFAAATAEIREIDEGDWR